MQEPTPRWVERQCTIERRTAFDGDAETELTYETVAESPFKHLAGSCSMSPGSAFLPARAVLVIGFVALVTAATTVNTLLTGDGFLG